MSIIFFRVSIATICDNYVDKSDGKCVSFSHLQANRAHFCSALLYTISTKHPSAHKTGNVENHHFDNHRLAGMSFEDMIVDLAGTEQHEARQQL